MYADDICCFAPSFKGLQRLVDTCVEFAAKHNIVFNCRKTKAMYFPCKFFKTTDHNLTVNDQHVEFVNSIKYLGVTISSVLSDELDIKARVRSRRVARIWKRGGGYFERVRSVQTTLTRILIDLESVSDGLSET